MTPKEKDERVKEFYQIYNHWLDTDDIIKGGEN